MRQISISVCSVALITALTGCVVNSDKGYSNDPYRSNYNNNYNAPKYGSNEINVYDLVNKDYQYSANRMQARDFSPMGAMKSGNDHLSWWYNSKTDQCYEMKSANGVVTKLNPKPAGDCKHAPQGQMGGQPHASGSRFPDVPKSAKAACINRFGQIHFDHIKGVSPLKPGFWEIVLKGKGHRQVACTVDQYGNISDWVEM